MTRTSLKAKNSLETTLNSKLRSFAAEGTVFWLIVVAAVEITAGATPGGFVGFIFAFVNIVLAWLCWTNKKPAFLIAIALALLTVVGAYPFPFKSAGSPFDAEIGTLLIVGSLLIALSGFRAFREMHRPNTVKTEG
ncbi:MAG: hypothetical protein ABSF65_08995 [Candidatus Bathyarchaeia archaeon]|jgi:hypothetical protein